MRWEKVEPPTYKGTLKRNIVYGLLSALVYLKGCITRNAKVIKHKLFDTVVKMVKLSRVG